MLKLITGVVKIEMGDGWKVKLSQSLVALATY